MANQVAYGFMTLQDLFGRRVTEVGVSVIDAAINASVAEHQRQIDALSGLFVRRTTDFKTRYRSATVARLQPMDERGRALPIKPAGQYDIAFPMQRGGIALGFSYEASIHATVQEVNEATNTLLMADARWMRDHILAALFFSTNGGWTFTDDLHGDLTVYGLANGDTTVYSILSGADQGATDTAYLAQAASISDADNPFPGIYAELTEHPDNGGQVVALVPTNLIEDVKALATFYPSADANLRLGANETQLTGGLGVAIPGQLIGYESSKVWIVEWRSLPDNYIIAVTTEGERPLAMREDTAPELRGFKRVADRNDHPWYEQQWLRKAGFGAWNRVGAVVQRIGNASYAIPTNYGSPMP
jgi:hypothetical protein